MSSPNLANCCGIFTGCHPTNEPKHGRTDTNVIYYQYNIGNTTQLLLLIFSLQILWSRLASGHYAQLVRWHLITITAPNNSTIQWQLLE